MIAWKWLAVTAAVSVSAMGAAGAAVGRQVRIDVKPDRIAVEIDGKLFTALRIDKEARKLYLHPINTASGKRVTRGFPMEQVAGESTDHAHQRGVWIGAENMTGGDFWENEPSYNNPKSGTVSLTRVSDVRQGAGEGAFTIQADWIGHDGQKVLTETRTMTFRAPTADTRTIDIDLVLKAKTRVTFDDHHDALVGLRLGTPFEIAHGGRVLNAEGLNEWDKLRGSRSAWVDSLAVVEGEAVGVAMMDAPTNLRFPTPWHVREYALIFASPFASHDYNPSAPDGSVTLQPGEALKLRYRILVHPASANVADAFKEFAGR